MTGGSIREYAKTMRERCWKADRKGKTRILDEFTTVTGYHRKAAIRLLGRVDDLMPKAQRGRRREYGPEVAEPQSDIFALGATIHFLITGYLPISDECISGGGPQPSDFEPVFPPIRTIDQNISGELEKAYLFADIVTITIPKT